MPTFCRHNRLLQNCPICSREQQVEMRAVVSPSTPAVSRRPSGGGTDGQSRTGSGASSRTPASRAARGGSRSPGVRVRRMARGAEDGYQSGLVPGLRSSADAARLAEEIAFAATRLALLESDPPGLYAEVASASSTDVEERTWIAFLIALIGTEDDAEDPFAAARTAARASWASGEAPELSADIAGPRSAGDAVPAGRTIEAYRAWAARGGSQAAALTGEPSWTPERRFERTFERLALPGLHRDARFDFLVTLGRLGVHDLRARTLKLGGENAVTLAAKRVLGIGDPLLLDRRATELADASAVDLEALDVGFFNWESGRRFRFGVPPDVEPDPEVLGAVLEALELD